MSEQKRFDMILGKQRARARLREFIGKHVPNRKNARVLCLPGENGREIEHVYRKLGFRDENIIGVEADSSVVKKVKSHYPKINTHFGSVDEFAKNYDGPCLSVISLDYCGVYDSKKMNPVGELALADKLADRVVFATNFFVGREKGSSLESIRDSHANTIRKYEEEIKAGLIVFKPDPDVDPNATMGRVRSRAMQDAITDVMLSAVPSLRVFGPTQDREGVVNNIVSNFKMAGAEDPKLLDDDGLLNVMAKDLIASFAYKKAGTFIPMGFESYSYVNDRGHRMDCDFSAFRRPLTRELSGVCGLVVNQQDEHFTVRLDPHPTEFESLEEYFEFVFEEGGVMARLEHFNGKGKLKVPKRIHLGGGAIPFDSEKTKANVVAMLKKGRSDDEILSRYPVTVGTLRALKAHITMGTFEEA